MIEGAPLQKWGKNIEFVLDVPETSIPVDVSYADEPGILYNNDEDLVNVIICFTGRETLEYYHDSLEEVRNVAIAHEIDELAIDIADLQRIFRGQTQNLKSIIQGLFRGSDTKVYLRAKPIRIPETQEEIQQVLMENHNTTIKGHGEYKRTLRRIVTNYQWSNMYNDILNYVKSCKECQRQKTNRKPTRMPLCITDTPEHFNDKIAVDVVGPLQETSKGKRYILTIQDQLTKYLMARAMKDQKTSTIVETFVKSYISIFGPPKNILTDNGTNFTGQLMKEFNDWMKMKHITTTAFHPESNDSLERSHYVIKEYLKTTAEDLINWDDYVEMACYSYNSATHEATGYTSYKLVYGIKPRNLASTDKLVAKTYSEYIEELKRRTERIVKTARQQISASKEEVKERYDRFSRPAEFKPGDFVWMIRETGDKSSGQINPQLLEPTDLKRTLEHMSSVIEISLSLFIVRAQERRMANKLGIFCVRQIIKVHSRGMSKLPDSIGARDVVGYGFNGVANYMDRFDFPMPAIRFKENTPDIMALREKEKGDWKKLSIEEKKALYRASFCQTFSEMDAPTGEWKQTLGVTLIIISAALWYFFYLRAFVYPPMPITFNEDRLLAQLDRMKKLNMNPITGNIADK
ncbi:hypothetical protein KM043_016479 [Ampulex compressa]|nr:hypothetical protein KM043_016479 [Ampulex compressa]